MKVKIVGLRNVDFTDKKSGNRITGVTVYGLKENKDVAGYEGKKFFIGSNRFDTSALKCNDIINVYFDENGKLDSIELNK